MNHKRFLPLLLCLPLLSACDKSDPSDFTFEFSEPGTFSEVAAVSTQQQRLLDTYGVHFVTSFSDVFSHFEWTSYNSLQFVSADAADSEATLNAFATLSSLLGDLPAEAVGSLPGYVVVADSIAFDCNLVNYNNTADTLYTRQTLLAYNAQTFVALAGFGGHYDQETTSTLKQLWTAAILTHWLRSLPSDSYPQAFFDYAVELQGGGAYNMNFTGSYFPLSVYPQYNMETYGCFDYMFRRLSTYYGYFAGAGGEPYRLSYDVYMTVYIDLACHLAFALYATDTERSYYENHPTANGAFVEKQRLALDYAADVLGWDIE